MTSRLSRRHVCWPLLLACCLSTWARPSSAAGTDSCAALSPLPVVPASASKATSFCVNGRCAIPDDDADDTDALDAALDQSEGRILVLPPGRYLISRSLRIKRRGVTLWGPGATIQGTNAADRALIVEADGVSIYGLRLVGATAQRGSRVEETAIAIYGPRGSHRVVHDTIVRDNRIEAGANGNSTGGAGIFVDAADGFLIAGNTIERTLADGIHLTGGARNGRVLHNTVRETGDDMIAIVSYAYRDPNTDTAASIAPDFARSRATYQDQNILVADNTLSGQYWGRGIAVVGGRDVTIRNNHLENLPYGAAILLAREPQTGSYGLDDVRVEGNEIRDVQTGRPPWDVGGKFAAHGRTGHGAIEVESAIFEDEARSPVLAEAFAVTRIALRGNTVESSATPAVRVGVGSGGKWTVGARAVDGSGELREVTIDGNQFNAIHASKAIEILSSAKGISCEANRLDGALLPPASCAMARGPTPEVPGSTVGCR